MLEQSPIDIQEMASHVEPSFPGDLELVLGVADAEIVHVGNNFKSIGFQMISAISKSRIKNSIPFNFIFIL